MAVSWKNHFASLFLSILFTVISLGQAQWPVQLPKLENVDPSSSDTNPILTLAKGGIGGLDDIALKNFVNGKQAAPAKCTPIYRRCTPKSKSKFCCGTHTCQESQEPTDPKEYYCLPSNSTDGSSPNPDGKCPYTSRVEQILEPLRDGEEFNHTVEYLAQRKFEYISKTAYRGNAIQNYQMSIREIHLMMRESYRQMIQAIGNNIYPLIIASDNEPGSVSGVGGTFTLYLEDGSMKRITPTSPEFEMLKNLAHMPLGIFTIISPYFLLPNAPNWIGPLRAFQLKVQDAIKSARLMDGAPNSNYPAQNSGQVESAGNSNFMSEALKSNSLNMLEITDRYLTVWLNRGIVTVDDFERYTRDMIPLVESNIKRAAALQVQALLPHLQRWKDELGDEKWKQVYALIPTIWPVSAINPRLQVLSQLMSAEQVRGQVLMLENGGSVLDQRATMGRILGDRAAALLILGTQTKEQEKLTFALSTKQDLLANSCQDAIKNFFDGVRVKK